MPILTNPDELVRAETVSWRQYLKSAIRTPSALAAELELPANLVCPRQSGGNFPLFVPQPFLDRIRRGDPNDPLLRQILPVEAESDDPPGFVLDPLGEAGFHERSGLLHKYEGRALLVVNGACAVHCRYCFRRHFPYSDTIDLSKDWRSAVDLIEQDHSIREIILSGGDPLTIVDEKLQVLIERLSAIEHLRRLRIHTRLPIVIPNRVTPELLSLLGESSMDVVCVIHCNHAQEIDLEVELACRALHKVCTAVLNQSVLLRGVNDNVEALVGLSERLFDANVLPYYLHQLDRVVGAAHFEVALERGQDLMNQLRTKLPGYLVPRYVREKPGEPNKTVIA